MKNNGGKQLEEDKISTKEIPDTGNEESLEKNGEVSG